jgi:hypothetical protein
MWLRGVEMRTTLLKMHCTALLGFGIGLCLLAGCAKEDKVESVAGGTSPSLANPRSQFVLVTVK